MREREQSWPPSRPGREPHDREAVRWPPETVSPTDREAHDDREVVPSRPSRREREDGPRVQVVEPHSRDREASDEDGEWDETPRLPAYMSFMDEWRMVRSGATTAEVIEYARDGAYSIQEDGWWRNANRGYAYSVAAVAILVCDAVKFMCLRLPRFLIAIPAVLALGWALNHVPAVAWLTPDGWDFSTWWADPAPVVEVPVEAPIGQG